MVSSVTGQGVDRLLELIEEVLSGTLLERDIILKAGQMAQIAWLYEHAEVIEREDRADGSVAFGGEDHRARHGRI